MGGSILIETVFAWPGTGFLLNTAIFQRDIPLLQGTILVLCILSVALNLLVDMPQPLIDPRMTIEDTIGFAPRAHGLPASATVARSYALLERVGLLPAQFAVRYRHELSRGQRQRINIARALALQPRLLVLGEAVAALDKSVQALVLNLLQELKREQGLTYILISYDLHVIQYLCDRVMVMYLGQVIEIGPMEQTYSAARHPYTQALLSAVPSMDPKRRTAKPPLAGDPPNAISPPPNFAAAGRAAA